jgi:hypothetical protein
MKSVWIFAVCAALASCGRTPAGSPVEPVTIDEDVHAAQGDAAITVGGGADADADAGSDAGTPVATLPAVGGLWVVDGAGAPVGVLVQRGHPNLASTGPNGEDLLRDGALVYSPKAGVFFGLQMSTGKVLAPKLGVTDGSCSEPIVAGYYTADTFVSGQAYAFVFAGKWYRIKDYQPLEQVSCGGTVAAGADGKCDVHSGSCRGFPVQAFAPALPLSFPGPLAFAWLAAAK